MQPAAWPGATEIGAPGRLIRRRCEPRVAATAARAPDGKHALTARREVAEQLAGVAIRHDGADRDAQHQVVARRAGAIAALAVLATLGLIVALIMEVEQRRQRVVGFEKDRAAVAAVTAVGAAAGDELFAAKRDAAGASVAALDEDVDLVDEHRDGRGRRRPLALRRGW